MNPRCETSPPSGPPSQTAKAAWGESAAAPLPTLDTERLYTGRFFHVAAGVVLFMTGVALQFHFGQYVDYLGYSVDVLGRILSISIVGTLLIRLSIGRWIDHFGGRPVWLVAACVVTLTMAAMQFTSQLWLIVILRGLWAMAMASVMTTVAVFAAQIAPPRRRAESLGSIGLAGFLGMIIGPTLGDWIFAGATDHILPYRIFFAASALFSALSIVVIWTLRLPRPTTETRSITEPRLSGSGPIEHAGSVPRPSGSGPTHHTGSVPRPSGSGSFQRADALSSLDQSHQRATPADTLQEPMPAGAALPRLRPREQLRLIARHWPGAVMLVGVAFSMVFCLQSMFLERLAEQRGFMDIKVFFITYAPTAMVLRVVFRRLPQTIGRTRTLVGGAVFMIVGLVCLIGVDSQLGLILPGALIGAGHCFVFPSMVDLAADRLPPANRGTGTAVILAANDVGMIAGFLALGEIIETHGYDAAIATLAAILLLATALFTVSRRRVILGGLRDSSRDLRRPRRGQGL